MQPLLGAQPGRSHIVCCHLHRLQRSSTPARHCRAWLLLLLAQRCCAPTACCPATLLSCSTADRLLHVHPGCPPPALSCNPTRSVWQPTTACPQRVVPHRHACHADPAGLGHQGAARHTLMLQEPSNSWGWSVVGLACSCCQVQRSRQASGCRAGPG